MSISKYNKTGSVFTAVPENVDTFDNLTTKAAFEKYGDTAVQICAVFVSKNGYKYPQCITINEFVRLPLHMSDTIRDIMNDAEIVEDINNGLCGIRFTTWTDKQKNVHYSAEFVDM